MNEEKLEKVRQLFKEFPEVKLVYFFGSRANQTAGPMSDYDFGVLLGSNEDFLNIQSILQAKLSLIFKTDNIDVAILNSIQNPDLAYNIIAKSKLIYEVKPYKVIAEPRILNRYFDFKLEREKNNLIKVSK